MKMMMIVGGGQVKVVEVTAAEGDTMKNLCLMTQMMNVCKKMIGWRKCLLIIATGGSHFHMFVEY